MDASFFKFFHQIQGRIVAYTFEVVDNGCYEQ